MTEPAHEEQPKSGIWLALRVLDEPSTVFRQLAARPQWVVPVIAFVLAIALFAFATPTAVLREQTRDQMEAFGSRGQLTEEQIQERIDAAGSPGSRAVVLGFGIVGGLVALVVVTGVLLLIFGALSAEPLRFKDEWAIVTHAGMASVLGTVVVIALMLFAGMTQPTLSLGFLFNQDQSPFLYRFANQVTLFGAWNAFLVALGNQIKTGAKNIGQPLAIVIGLWLLVKLVFAAVGTAFGG